MKTQTIAITVALLSAGLAGCSQASEAEELCRDALEAELGEDGVVKVSDVEEQSSGALTKVEGNLAYREEQGAGDRHDTWFICQLEGSEGDLSVSDLTIK